MLAFTEDMDYNTLTMKFKENKMSVATTTETIAETLRLHKLWLEDDPRGRQVVAHQGAFGGGQLRDADLTDAYLMGADLTGADLRGADLTDAHLNDACLINADLRGAYLTDANLTGACLMGADLTGACLMGADLTDAILTDADFTGADLHEAQIHLPLTAADLI